MKTRVLISIVFIGLGLLLAAIPQNTTVKYKLTAEEMLSESSLEVMYYSTDEVAELIIQKDPSIQLIDVRAPEEFEKFALPNAINIPITELLSEEYRDYLDQETYYNIFYSNGTTNSLRAWMISRQLGWENNYVLQGGLNHWAETILNPQAPASTNANDEIAKYEFRKGAQQALSSGIVSSTEVNVDAKAPKPPVKKRPKKKRAQGGC